MIHFSAESAIDNVQKFSANSAKIEYVAAAAIIWAVIVIKKFRDNLNCTRLSQKHISITAFEIAESEVHKANPKYFKNGTNDIMKNAFNITEQIPNFTGDFVSPKAKYTAEYILVSMYAGRPTTNPESAAAVTSTCSGPNNPR